jgi:hypothetical protein
MLRIVGINKNESVAKEFLLIQNQSGVRICLRGHALMGETCLTQSDREAFHAFIDDEFIMPRGYVVVHTGSGINRWGKSKDGTTVFHVYMGREVSVWNRADAPVHVMATSHSYMRREIPSRQAVLVL